MQIPESNNHLNQNKQSLTLSGEELTQIKRYLKTSPKNPLQNLIDFTSSQLKEKIRGLIKKNKQVKNRLKLIKGCLDDKEVEIFNQMAKGKQSLFEMGKTQLRQILCIVSPPQMIDLISRVLCLMVSEKHRDPQALYWRQFKLTFRFTYFHGILDQMKPENICKNPNYQSILSLYSKLEEQEERIWRQSKGAGHIFDWLKEIIAASKIIMETKWLVMEHNQIMNLEGNIENELQNVIKQLCEGQSFAIIKEDTSSNCE